MNLFSPIVDCNPGCSRVWQDYSWEDHGFSLVNRLYPDVGQMLDEKFQMAASLTYNTMASHKDVDTSMLRRAIWNYIHCMFGIRSVGCKRSSDWLGFLWRVLSYALCCLNGTIAVCPAISTSTCL